MLPIRDTIPSRRPPLATWTLILVNAGVFIFQLTLAKPELERLVYLFGVVPRRFVHPDWAVWAGIPADDLWPFVTSMFLHGGWLHVISNMWTLSIFGDNVEDRMGSVRFVLFYLVCGLAAGVLHLLTNPNSAVPAIGASGAIAGILAAYLVLYPFSRILCLIPIFFVPLFLELPAFLFILIWFWTQFYSGTLSLLAPGHGGGIAWWAHVGGFLAGILLLKYFVPRPRPRRRLLTGS